MAKFAKVLGLFLSILGSNPARAQKTWTIEQMLDGSKYQCAGTDDASANFKISFERVRRHHGASRLVAFYSGELANGVSVNSRGINAQIDMIDPVHKKFEMDISDFPWISLFHKGHVRHLQTRAYFNSAYDTIEGKLIYVIGRKRDHDRRRVELSYGCVAVANSIPVKAPVQGQ